MKVKDYGGREHDVFSVSVEADRDGRGEVYFYVMGKTRGDCGSVKTCCIDVFRGLQELDAALDLQQEIRSGRRKEQEAALEKARELQP
ncbi:MAG: hypothetical protein HDR14_14785 [Lachnospiraceae bacterium]|nr:hypothetical protein [Lachnospiraceae bacterium]